MALQGGAPTPLIDVDDAKAQLNIPASDSSQDQEIADFVDAATEVIGWFVGQSTDASTFTDWVTPNWGTPGPNLGVYGSGYVSITLSELPIVSVTSIQPNFYQVGALDLTGIKIDAESGTVWLPTNQLFLGPCVVTYVAGRVLRPAVLKLACRFLVQDLWVTQRGPAAQGGPLSPGQEMQTVPGLGMVSARVLDLLRMNPHHAAPGFA